MYDSEGMLLFGYQRLENSDQYQGALGDIENEIRDHMNGKTAIFVLPFVIPRGRRLRINAMYYYDFRFLTSCYDDLM